MDKVTPELLEVMRKEFKEAYSSNQRIQACLKLAPKFKTYRSADTYAMQIGQIREKIILKHLPNISPEEYAELATLVVLPQLKDNFKHAADFAAEVQDALNKKAGLGLKAVSPKFNNDKAGGLITKISAAETLEDAKAAINQNITTFTKGVVSDALHDNADFHYGVGLEPVIRRVPFSGCCSWCTSMGGVYDYKDVKNAGNDVYRFHANCRCYIMYDPQDGGLKISTKTQRAIK